ncbi:hypothetical protein AAHE18_02G034600 [Arachis hypogaea]
MISRFHSKNLPSLNSHSLVTLSLLNALLGVSSRSLSIKMEGPRREMFVWSHNGNNSWYVIFHHTTVAQVRFVISQLYIPQPDMLPVIRNTAGVFLFVAANNHHL